MGIGVVVGCGGGYPIARHILRLVLIQRLSHALAEPFGQANLDPTAQSHLSIAAAAAAAAVVKGGGGGG
jgi:hypothetical protein